MAGLAFSVHKAAGCSVAAAGGSGGGGRDGSLFARGRRRRRSQPLFACHDRATQAEESVWPPRCYRVGERKLQVSRLDSLAFSVPKAGAARVGLRMVPVVAAATSQHLSALEL